MPSYMRAPPEAATMMTAAAMGRAILDYARDAFADDRAHGGGEETEIHHRDCDFVAFDQCVTAQHRVNQSGAVLIFAQAILVARHALELKGVDRGQSASSSTKLSGSQRFAIRSLADRVK